MVSGLELCVQEFDWQAGKMPRRPSYRPSRHPCRGGACLRPNECVYAASPNGQTFAARRTPTLLEADWRI